MEQITISQNDNQLINLQNNDNQQISINQNQIQDIELRNTLTETIDITQNDNQLLYINGGGVAVGISDVLQNGVSVVSGNIAYVIVPTKTSELQNNSGFITTETDPTVPSYVKQISLADINSWNNKQDELVSGSNIKTINNNSILGNGNLTITGTEYTAGDGIDITNNIITNTITSYDNLTDLPTIPEKVSDLTNDLDFVSENDLSEVAFTGSYASLSNTPENLSEFTNDEGFITNTVNDLTNYTLSSNLSSVATSGDYDDLINKPTIPTATSQLTNDSNFVTNTDYSSYSNAGVLKSGEVNCFGVNSSGYAYCDTLTYATYLDRYPANFISKGTLENVITGKGLIDTSDLNTALSTKQDTLVSGTNIKTINNTSLLGSGDLTITGSSTDVQINGTSITSGGVANIITESAYNSSTNKIATKNDIPTSTSQLTNNSGFIDNTVNNLTNYMLTTDINTALGNKQNKPLFLETISISNGSGTATFSFGTHEHFEMDVMTTVGTKFMWFGKKYNSGLSFSGIVSTSVGASSTLVIIISNLGAVSVYGSDANIIMSIDVYALD